jgi:hypothetical protein
MAASPYDLRKKTRKAQLDDVRRQAQARMETVSKLEKSKQFQEGARLTPKAGVPQNIRDAQRRRVEGEGRTGPATVMNGNRFPTVAKAQQESQTRRVWQVGLGAGNSPARQATRGTLVIKDGKRYYRRKSDGKAIPIDSSGRVIRRRGVSP